MIVGVGVGIVALNTALVAALVVLPARNTTAPAGDAATEETHRVGSPTPTDLPERPTPQASPTPTTAGEERVSVPVFAEGMVLDVMYAARAQGSLAFSGTEYPGLGFFMEEIQGVRQGNGRYWILYLNGKAAEQGASHVRVAPTDTLEWRLEESPYR